MPLQQEGTEYIARQVESALEAADLIAFSDLLHPNVTWGAPDDPSPSCQNRKQVLAWYQRGRESGVRAKVSEITIFGDKILVGLRVAGREGSTAADGVDERWQILTVRDGRVGDIVGFETRAEAIDRVEYGSHLGEATGETRWFGPETLLSDERVELRLPQHSDAMILHAYANESGGLDGSWVPVSEGASLQSCEALIADWLAAWENRRSYHGPALAIVDAGGAKIVGQIGFGDKGDGVVEVVYGVAPSHRGRGYASCALRLAVQWLLDAGLASEVELLISQDNIESQGVATSAGFSPTGTVPSHLDATGVTYDDLRFVMRPV